MRVMIAGGGSVGTAIALDLVDRHHDVTLLEQVSRRPRSSRRCCRASTSWPPTRASTPTWPRPTCAASTSSSPRPATTRTTSSISWLSKQEFGVPRVISRINNSRNEWLFNESWGVDVSVSTPSLITSLVDEAVEVGAHRQADGPRPRPHATHRGHARGGLAGGRPGPHPRRTAPARRGQRRRRRAQRPTDGADDDSMQFQEHDHVILMARDDATAGVRRRVHRLERRDPRGMPDLA